MIGHVYYILCIMTTSTCGLTVRDLTRCIQKHNKPSPMFYCLTSHRNANIIMPSIKFVIIYYLHLYVVSCTSFTTGEILNQTVYKKEQSFHNVYLLLLSFLSVAELSDFYFAYVMGRITSRGPFDLCYPTQL